MRSLKVVARQGTGLAALLILLAGATPATGHQVDPFVTQIGYGEPSSGCLDADVSEATIVDLCGDEDGCSMAMAADIPNSALRALASTRRMIIDSSGEGWWMDWGHDLPNSGGVNEDGSSTLILQVKDSFGEVYCELYDDANEILARNFAFRVCVVNNNPSGPDQTWCHLKIFD